MSGASTGTWCSRFSTGGPALETGLVNRLESWIANAFKVSNSNLPDAAGSLREGKVSGARRPADGFLQFAWRALRSGVLDLISH